MRAWNLPAQNARLNCLCTVSYTHLDVYKRQSSTNPGQPARPLKEVASGGELSRIMLAVKAVLADRDAIGLSLIHI